MRRPTLRRPTTHSVTTQQVVDGRWIGTCTCGIYHLSTLKEQVDAWRRWHYREARS